MMKIADTSFNYILTLNIHKITLHAIACQKLVKQVENCSSNLKMNLKVTAGASKSSKCL